MEAIDFLKPHVVLQCMQYSHVDMDMTAQLMSGWVPRKGKQKIIYLLCPFIPNLNSREA